MIFQLEITTTLDIPKFRTMKSSYKEEEEENCPVPSRIIKVSLNFPCRPLASDISANDKSFEEHSGIIISRAFIFYSYIPHRFQNNVITKGNLGKFRLRETIMEKLQCHICAWWRPLAVEVFVWGCIDNWKRELDWVSIAVTRDSGVIALHGLVVLWV